MSAQIFLAHEKPDAPFLNIYERNVSDGVGLVVAQVRCQAPLC